MMTDDIERHGWCAYLTLLVVMCFAASSHAGEWTATAGTTRFTPHDDGVWYQKAFPYSLDMTSGSYGIRYDMQPSEAGWSVGGGFQRLGSVSSSALAVALDGREPGDGGYNSATQSCNGECWPLSRWYGHGSVKGVFVAATKHYGPWELEGGIYLYQPRWEMYVPDWIPERNAEPRPITVRHHARWQLGPMFGIRYKPEDWKGFSVGVSAWQTQTQNSEFCSLYRRYAINASAGYSW